MSSRDLLFFALGLAAAWLFSRARGSFRIQTRSTHRFETERDKPLVTAKTNVTVKKNFVVNGKAYASLDEVPSPFREKLKETLKDENGDGIPDILQKR